MQFERSPTLLPRHGSLLPGSVGCFSIEDLKELYDAKSPEFRSASVPRRLPGPPYCVAPRYNNSSAPYVSNISAADSDEDEGDGCNPGIFRKAKTHIPRKKSLYSTFSHLSLNDDSDSDSSQDEEDCFRGLVFSRSLTVRRRTDNSISVKKASAEGNSTAGEAPFARVKALRPDRRSHGSGPVHVPSSNPLFPGPRMQITSSSSESSISLHSSSALEVRPHSTSISSPLSAPRMVLEEQDVLALPRAGLGLVQCDDSWRIKIVESGSSSMEKETRPDTNASNNCHISMSKQHSLAQGKVSGSPNRHRCSPGSATDETGSLERLSFNKPRHCAVERAKALSHYTNPMSTLGSRKGKDHRPPLSSNGSRPSSASNSPAREGSPKPPFPRASSSDRCLKKSHSEMEMRTHTAAASAPKSRPNVEHSSRALVRAHSESERSAVKPKSILVVRESGLDRASSVGRRVRFNDQVDLFRYPTKSTLSRTIP